MRVALHDESSVAVRAGQVLLAERDLTVLGLLERDPTTHDPRIERVDDLAGYDVLVTDAHRDMDGLVEEALEAGIGCVLFAGGPDIGERYGSEFDSIGRTLIVGANLATGIARCLAAHETARGGEVLGVTCAWTEPGSRLRRGEPVAFPDPVGALWAKRRRGRDKHDLVAPVEGDWAAATAAVTSVVDGGVVSRVVGVADLSAHLQALALASAAIAIDSYASGAHLPEASAERYLMAALGAGLDVAAHTAAA
ncbi:MAG TPA: hypothetical protein VGC47_00195 [Acidimicrobiia bacterium]|jgi:hypothetical protein